MSRFNKVIMIGNLTRDPDYRSLPSGQSVCTLGLATSRPARKATGGEMQAPPEVCFIDISVWGAQADSCRDYLKKGRMILVEGRLRLDTWNSNDGEKRSKHTIVAENITFLGGGGAEDNGSDATSSKGGFINKGEVSMSDDDLPF